MAVQLAKAKGAIAIGTASGKNEKFVRDLGADEFVDYTRQPFEEVVKDVDVVFDTIGSDTQERAFQTLKKGGFLVTSAQNGAPNVCLVEPTGSSRSVPVTVRCR